MKKETLKLKKGHSWKAPPGYRIFVADRGAVRFNFPQDWVLKPDSDSVKLYDQDPPDDNCVLGFSYFRFPPTDWSGLPLSNLVESATLGDSRALESRGPLIKVDREDIELVWAEFRFIDPNENREAFSRLSIGRGANLHTLITLDFWADDETRITPVWNEIMRSLELGRYIEDPTVGDVIH
jgi:hypothetical protein